MSFSSKGSVGDVPYADEDILAFDTISGVWSMYFDGSDVGLTTYYEDVDAISLAPYGNLLVSTSGGYSVDSLSGTDADLLKFVATDSGDVTAGSWELYFDGSDIELTSSTYKPSGRPI